MDISFEPLHDFILTKTLPPEEMKTQHGIILPGEVEHGTVNALVLKVGPGLYLDGGKRVVPDLQRGDIILLQSNSGLAINLDGAAFEIVRYDSVIGVISRRNPDAASE